MASNSVQIQSPFLKKLIISFTLFTFISTLILPPSFVSAQSIFSLPKPGILINPSDGFNPVVLSGIKIFPDNPLRFDFILNPGQSSLSSEALKDESSKLIKYFLATLTVPDKDLWVNLSPYEKDRIIPNEFGFTEMGRDLLAQDYILKQLTASLMYPEQELGKKFWAEVYEKAAKLYNTTNVPVNTFNKVWIVPDKAVIYEHKDTAVILESHLKVMLESDYMALKENASNQKFGLDKLNQKDSQEINDLSSRMIKELIIPALEKEVNEGKNFANLRQIYQSMILATWFKKNLKDNVINKIYAGQNKISGVDLDDKTFKEKIYKQYLEAFKIGVYDYIKEEYDPATQEIIPRKYFSGGFEGTQLDAAMTTIAGATKLTSTEYTQVQGLLDKAMVAEVRLDPSDKAMNSSEERSEEEKITSISSVDLKKLLNGYNKYLKSESILSAPIKLKPNLLEVSPIQAVFSKATPGQGAVLQTDLPRLYYDSTELEPLLDQALQGEMFTSGQLQQDFAVVLAAWIGGQEEDDFVNIYLPRDMGYGYTVDRALDYLRFDQPSKSAGIYHLSRASLGQRNYSWVQFKIDELSKQGFSQSEFLQKLGESILENSDPTKPKGFSKAIDAILKDMQDLGYDQFKKVRFLDSGFKTFPLMLQAIFQVRFGAETQGRVLESSLKGYLPAMSLDSLSEEARGAVANSSRRRQIVNSPLGLAEQAGSFLVHPFEYSASTGQMELQSSSQQSKALELQRTVVMGVVQFERIRLGLEEALVEQGVNVARAHKLVRESMREVLGIKNILDKTTGIETELIKPLSDVYKSFLNPDKFTNAVYEIIQNNEPQLDYKVFSKSVEAKILRINNLNPLDQIYIKPMIGSFGLGNNENIILKPAFKENYNSFLKNENKNQDIQMVSMIQEDPQKKKKAGRIAAMFLALMMTQFFGDNRPGEGSQSFMVTQEVAAQSEVLESSSIDSENSFGYDGTIFSRGAKGPLVRELKERFYRAMGGMEGAVGALRFLNDNEYEIEGDLKILAERAFEGDEFDVNFERIVVGFQLSTNLVPDGDIGPETMRQLDESKQDIADFAMMAVKKLSPIKQRAEETSRNINVMDMVRGGAKVDGDSEFLNLTGKQISEMDNLSVLQLRFGKYFTAPQVKAWLKRAAKDGVDPQGITHFGVSLRGNQNALVKEAKLFAQSQRNNYMKLQAKGAIVNSVGQLLLTGQQLLDMVNEHPEGVLRRKRDGVYFRISHIVVDPDKDLSEQSEQYSLDFAPEMKRYGKAKSKQTETPDAAMTVTKEEAMKRGLTRQIDEDEYDSTTSVYRAWYGVYKKEIEARENAIATTLADKSNAKSEVEAYLAVLDNSAVGISKFNNQFNPQRANRVKVLELGAGDTSIANKIADSNQDIDVIATDEWDSNPQTATPDYLKYAEDFEDGKLLAQKSGLENLAVLRAHADIVRYLPDGSLDHILLVNPAIASLKELIVLIREFEFSKKLKPGGKIIIKALPTAMDYLKSADGFKFQVQNDSVVFGVDLRASENSEWNQELFDGPVIVGVPVDAAMTAQSSFDGESFDRNMGALSFFIIPENVGTDRDPVNAQLLQQVLADVQLPFYKKIAYITKLAREIYAQSLLQNKWSELARKHIPEYFIDLVQSNVIGGIVQYSLKNHDWEKEKTFWEQLMKDKKIPLNGAGEPKVWIKVQDLLSRLALMRKKLGLPDLNITSELSSENISYNNYRSYGFQFESENNFWDKFNVLRDFELLTAGILQLTTEIVRGNPQAPNETSIREIIKEIDEDVLPLMRQSQIGMARVYPTFAGWLSFSLTAPISDEYSENVRSAIKERIKVINYLYPETIAYVAALAGIHLREVIVGQNYQNVHEIDRIVIQEILKYVLPIVNQLLIEGKKVQARKYVVMLFNSLMIPFSESEYKAWIGEFDEETFKELKIFMGLLDGDQGVYFQDDIDVRKNPALRYFKLVVNFPDEFGRLNFPNMMNVVSDEVGMNTTSFYRENTAKLYSESNHPELLDRLKVNTEILHQLPKLSQENLRVSITDAAMMSSAIVLQASSKIEFWKAQIQSGWRSTKDWPTPSTNSQFSSLDDVALVIASTILQPNNFDARVKRAAMWTKIEEGNPNYLLQQQLIKEAKRIGLSFVDGAVGLIGEQLYIIAPIEYGLNGLPKIETDEALKIKNYINDARLGGHIIGKEHHEFLGKALGYSPEAIVDYMGKIKKPLTVAELELNKKGFENLGWVKAKGSLPQSEGYSVWEHPVLKAKGLRIYYRTMQGNGEFYLASERLPFEALRENRSSLEEIFKEVESVNSVMVNVPEAIDAAMLPGIKRAMQLSLLLFALESIGTPAAGAMFGKNVTKYGKVTQWVKVEEGDTLAKIVNEVARKYSIDITGWDTSSLIELLRKSNLGIVDIDVNAGERLATLRLVEAIETLDILKQSDFKSAMRWNINGNHVDVYFVDLKDYPMFTNYRGFYLGTKILINVDSIRQLAKDRRNKINRDMPQLSEGQALIEELVRGESDQSIFRRILEVMSVHELTHAYTVPLIDQDVKVQSQKKFFDRYKTDKDPELRHHVAGEVSAYLSQIAYSKDPVDLIDLIDKSFVPTFYVFYNPIYIETAEIIKRLFLDRLGYKFYLVQEKIKQARVMAKENGKRLTVQEEKNIRGEILREYAKGSYMGIEEYPMMISFLRSLSKQGDVFRERLKAVALKEHESLFAPVLQGFDKIQIPGEVMGRFYLPSGQAAQSPLDQAMVAEKSKNVDSAMVDNRVLVRNLAIWMFVSGASVLNLARNAPAAEQIIRLPIQAVELKTITWGIENKRANEIINLFLTSGLGGRTELPVTSYDRTASFSEVNALLDELRELVFHQLSDEEIRHIPFGTMVNSNYYYYGIQTGIVDFIIDVIKQKPQMGRELVEEMMRAFANEFGHGGVSPITIRVMANSLEKLTAANVQGEFLDDSKIKDINSLASGLEQYLSVEVKDYKLDDLDNEEEDTSYNQAFEKAMAHWKEMAPDHIKLLEGTKVPFERLHGWQEIKLMIPTQNGQQETLISQATVYSDIQRQIMVYADILFERLVKEKGLEEEWKKIAQADLVTDQVQEARFLFSEDYQAIIFMGDVSSNHWVDHGGYSPDESKKSRRLFFAQHIFPGKAIKEVPSLADFQEGFQRLSQSAVEVKIVEATPMGDNTSQYLTIDTTSQLPNNLPEGSLIKIDKVKGKDDAMKATDKENVGGIDLNSEMLNIQTQGEGIKMNANIDPKIFESFTGFTPVIIQIVPLVNGALLLGLSSESSSNVAELSSVK